MKAISDQMGHILILDKDEKVVQSLTTFAQQKGLRSGRIHAIGALKKVELGYYELHNKSYIRKTFDQDEFELISLHGNVTEKEGQAFIHVHAALGRSDFSVFGGHLFEAEVAVTCEIFVTPFSHIAQREFKQDVGLYLICGKDQI